MRSFQTISFDNMSGIGTHVSSRGLLQRRPDHAKWWVSNENSWACRFGGRWKVSSSARSSALSSRPRAPPNASKVSSPGAKLAISPWIVSKLNRIKKQNDPKIQAHAYHHSHDPLKSTCSNDQKQINVKQNQVAIDKSNLNGPAMRAAANWVIGNWAKIFSNSATRAYHTLSAKQDFWSPPQTHVTLHWFDIFAQPKTNNPQFT